MKFTIIIITGFMLCVGTSIFAQQYVWKLAKDKDGIDVYQSSVANSNFKCIKVECTLEGNYQKLINIITDVSHHKDWVYNNKTAYIINKVSPVEFYYYTETYLPWPMSNRDAVVHEKIDMDTLKRFLSISETSESTYIPEKDGIVRVTRSSVSWYVRCLLPQQSI